MNRYGSALPTNRRRISSTSRIGELGNNNATVEMLWTRDRGHLRWHFGDSRKCCTVLASRSLARCDGTKVALTGTLLYTAHCAIYDARRTDKRFFSQPEEGQATQPMKPKRTILCADSNEQALSIRKILLETRGYRVLTCTRGEDALARFAQGGVDLVLADLALNGLDGARLVQETKKASPATPAILLSSKARILDAGTPADAFFSKGAQTPAELLERVRQLLVRKRGPKRPVDAHSGAVGVGAA